MMIVKYSEYKLWPYKWQSRNTAIRAMIVMMLSTLLYSLPSFDLCITPKLCTMVLGHFLFTYPIFPQARLQIPLCISHGWGEPAFCCALFVDVRWWGTCCTRMKTSCSSIVTRTQEVMPGCILPPNIPGGRCSGVVKFSFHFPAILLLAHHGRFFVQPWRLWKEYVSSGSSLCCIVCF